MKQTVFQSQPATPVLNALTLSVNNSVTIANAASTQVIAANAARRRLVIANNSGVTMHLNFGAAATAAMITIRTGSTFVMDVGADGYIWQGTIEAFQNSGGPLALVVLEFV